MVFSLPPSLADPLQRRSLLGVDRVPDGAPDLLITLRFAWSNGTRVRVAYVADRAVLRAADWPPYAQALAPLSSGAPEPLTVLILNDLANQLVPLWLSVLVASADGGHQACGEEYRADWSNPALEQVGRSAAP